MSEMRSSEGPTLEARPYKYLAKTEVEFLDAAVARLIPADELGPGARETGVTAFIDEQLCSPWGVHGRNYRLGPWLEGTPRQGVQSPLTPQEIYRMAVREINQYCLQKFKRVFSQVDGEQQDAILQALEEGDLDLESFSGEMFFDLLLRNTMEGFFADPIHGGNRDKASWRMFGFPGVASSAYAEHLRKPEIPYRVEPVSILDIETGKVAVDAQGYAKHIPLSGNK